MDASPKNASANVTARKFASVVMLLMIYSSFYRPSAHRRVMCRTRTDATRQHRDLLCPYLIHAKRLLSNKAAVKNAGRSINNKKNRHVCGRLVAMCCIEVPRAVL